jgi:bifunctional non-homologous end joining protein LigD
MAVSLRSPGVPAWTASVSELRPMLASLEPAPHADEAWAYEPKYDGIRALVEIEPGGGAAGVRLWSRLGNDKTAQFPDLVSALARFARRLRAAVVLDGEIVALDESGEPAGFQRLQGRIHVADLERRGAGGAAEVALMVFDALRDGRDDLRSLPLAVRRARLERIVGRAGSRHFRLSRFVAGRGDVLLDDAAAHGWEGIIAKRLDSTYQTGRRSADWRKLKLQRTQSCVIGGWTEPRGSRAFFGALLLGVWADGGLEYIGHTGTGFTHAELERVFRLLRRLEVPTSPFRARPRTNERPHWVEPRLVAEVRFTEWTADSRLRHPTYLGLRDDVPVASVKRETAGVVTRPKAAPAAASKPSAATRAATSDTRSNQTSSPRSTPASGAGGNPASGARAKPASGARVKPGSGARARAGAVTRGNAAPVASPLPAASGLGAIVSRLEAIERGSGSGVVPLPGGQRLEVSHLAKVFWPASGITKGELMRFYVTVSPALLPAVADRPLIMLRHPDGVSGPSFYQQRAPAKVPPGVRTERLAVDRVVPRRLVGGPLVTLLYMVQLGVLSQDPWFSRVASPDAADHAVLDLDPMPGVPFARVLEVARWIHDELERLGVRSVPKTSGATGLHVYVPLPPGSPYDTARLFAQLVATVVAERHPRAATVERSVNARGRTVYVDYLQNSRGKTLATAYSARASEFAGVSTPLTWKEVHDGIERQAFTVRTVPARLGDAGDLWAAITNGRPADLDAALRRLGH